jgi:hypothetical protein
MQPRQGEKQWNHIEGGVELKNFNVAEVPNLRVEVPPVKQKSQMHSELLEAKSQSRIGQV